MSETNAENQNQLDEMRDELTRHFDRFTVDDWSTFINEWAAIKGWNDDKRTESEWVALAHTEISEAYEEWRNGKPMLYEGEDGKPEGRAIEYADLLIRVFHWFAAHDLNPSFFLREKMTYNLGRPFRHGGKLA